MVNFISEAENIQSVRRLYMKTSIIFIISGVVLLILSTITPFLIMISVLFPGGSPEHVFAAPGEIKINITKEGTYYLWNDYETEFNSKTYKSPETLPDNITYSLTDATGKKVDDITEDSSESQTVWNTKRASVGYYDLTPGEYTLSISGLDETRIFSFGRNTTEEMLPYIGIGILAAMLSTPIALIIIVIGIVLMVRHLMEKSRIRRLKMEADKEI